MKLTNLFAPGLLFLIVGAANAHTNECARKQPDEVEKMVKQHFQAARSRSAEHPIARDFFSGHEFDRSAYRHDGEFKWLVPFSVSYSNGRGGERYIAIVDCRGGVELSVDKIG